MSQPKSVSSAQRNKPGWDPAGQDVSTGGLSLALEINTSDDQSTRLTYLTLNSRCLGKSILPARIF